MKELDELELPNWARYTEDHEYVRPEGNKNLRVGISDYAQDQLGDIVFVELPQVGDTFEKGQEFGTIESVKAVIELYMPVGGEIIAINEALMEAPQLVNDEPYDEGWIIGVNPTNPKELEELMNNTVYLEMLKGLE